MDLKDYLRILRENWLPILLITLLGLGVAAGATALTKPKYTATTQVFVAVGGGDSATEILQGSSFSEKRVTSYVSLATSPRVLQPVIEELDLDTTPRNLAETVTANAPLQTVLINLSATHTDPETAAQIADATAASLIRTVGEVETPGDEREPLVDLSIVDPAGVPTSPSSPRTLLNLALGLVVGAALGVAYALLKTILDTRIRRREDIERITDAPVLGVVAEDKSAEDEPLLTVDDSTWGHRAESYRQLRTHLKFTNVDGGTQTVVVTSSVPGEGKTTTTTNLAVMLAESGTRVLLVDADLRRPRVAKTLGVEGAVGLSTILSGQIDVEDAVQVWGDSAELDVITAGEVPPNPSELLGAEAMGRFLDWARENYEIVLLDAPPLQPVTDPTVLAAQCSGVILVCRVDGYNHRDQLRGALENLEATGSRLLGLVLTRVPIKRSGYQYYDYQPDAAESTASHRSGGSRKRARQRSRASVTGMRFR
ncbi:polysaccharide biosynthesis tyrosine autokinase [Micrococcus sp. IITD107]|uniref:polysaccharide biosynthesis tyrosine autokinase n=1 Tax=Micrococcus sp. IITD107 TaxID=3342790 RepID=UPI0035B7D937